MAIIVAFQRGAEYLLICTAQDVEVIVTADIERHKGYGSKLMQLGNDVADEMDYICYLDSEKDAKGVYEKCGYVANTDVDQTSPLAAMVRPKKSQRS